VMSMHDETHPFEESILKALARDVRPLTKISHPTLETLLDHMTGDLSPVDREAVEAHCLVCPECGERLRALAVQLQTAEAQLHREVSKCWSFSALFEVAQRRVRKVRWVQRAAAAVSATAAATTLGLAIPQFIQLQRMPIARGQSLHVPSSLYLLVGLGLGAIVGLIAVAIWRKLT